MIVSESEPSTAAYGAAPQMVIDMNILRSLIIVYESVENGGDGGGGDGRRARGSDGAAAAVRRRGRLKASRTTTLHMLPYYFARHAHHKNDKI